MRHPRRHPAGSSSGGRFAPGHHEESQVDLTDETVTLDADKIQSLFHRLDERLREREISATLYVVGGAAMAVVVGAGRLTRDVDVSALDPVVATEALAVAHEKGLPPTWLNAAAAPWVPAPPAATASATPGLTIRYAPPEHLLAMKMVAHRERDLEDMRQLADLLGLRCAEAQRFEDVLRSAYPGDGELQQMLGVPDYVVDDEIRFLCQSVATSVRR